MYTQFTLKTAAACAVLAAITLWGGCSDPSSPTAGTSASIAIRARVVSPSAGKQLSIEQTTWDSLVIVLAYDGADTVRHAVALAMDNPVVTDTIDGIAADDNIRLSAQTVNTNGLVVHRALEQTIDLAPNETEAVTLWLEPVRSSIYIELTDVPTSVSTVAACFATDTDTLCRQTPRSPRITSLSIDNVPDGATGILTLAGLDSSGDTLYVTSVPLTSNAGASATIWADFTQSPAGLSANVTLTEPAPTLVAGSMTGSSAGGPEAGPLIISEIMYMANGAEYVELHNPTATDALFDTLIVDKDGDTRILTDVTVAAGGFFVLGRADSTWVDAVLPFLDLSSTSGNSLAIRTKHDEIVDWVAFVTRGNDIEWPDIPSARVSVVLDSLVVDPTYNNYGGHWRPACTPLSTDSSTCGTPGTPGL